jgi:fimbrial chaperone protein
MRHEWIRPATAGWWMLALIGALGPSLAAEGAGFSALITPPRFELRAQPGEVLRHVLEITNVADAAARLTVQTAEWEFSEDGAVVFANALADDSCRPWTALEARALELGPNARRRYRFEVAVPPDAAERECRFAILFEGEPELVGQLALPVTGRLGVIVYVAIGGARAQLALLHGSLASIENRQLPALTVRNTGTAHTRLEGFLTGRDAAGQELVFIPQNSPVLPGQTRTLALYPQAPAGAPSPVIDFPVRLSGRLEWSGARLDIDELFGGE